MTGLPQRTRVYQNHTLDSTRWDSFHLRPGDVIISTSYRSGTTWLQEIMRRLVFWHQSDQTWRKKSIDELSPWLDSTFSPASEILDLLEAQQHRRFIKSHLALDGLFYFPQARYLVAGRDPRDVFMSFYNHYSNLTDEVLTWLNEKPDRLGPPIPPVPTDIHEAWRNWITRGWFEWEREGYPYWGNMHHTRTWWEYRHLDNVLLIHYNDLMTDLPGEIRRIATFLDIPMSEKTLAGIVPDLSLSSLRSAAESQGAYTSFKGGAQTFFFKGTNGRWREVLTDDEVAMYDATAATLLTPDCRAWLELGSAAYR